ncbi:MAG: 4'-phosphopantetheinyl transferase superfamily protein [Dysgonamonadaceae bacterium]|nr:4'-phosphopantetheinyl transferase superfamily protein [Dysgonamonadaceae bacterium]
MNKNDIAIVGMSCYFPGANNIQEFWENLCKGVSSITDAPEDRIAPYYFANGGKTDVDQFYFKKGGFVTPMTLNPLDYGILPIAAEGIDQEHLIAMYLAKEALTDAGVFEKNTPLQKCGFILGKGNYVSAVGQRIAEFMYMPPIIEDLIKTVFPEATEEDIHRVKTETKAKLGRYQADTAAGSMPNLIVSSVVNRFDMKGPAYTIDAACASSVLAVEAAVNLLLSGQCDIALSGGLHFGQSAPFWSIFNIIGAASYKGQISPFSEDADGVLIGEGAGVLVLKKLDKAIADNDRIYAVIKACGSASDGADVSILAPSMKGQVNTLKQTWDKTEIDPKKIGYVETHGTATQVGDRVEIATLTDFFGDNTSSPALLGSVKSNIGHAMHAAGIAGLIKTVLALYHKKIPPTLNCEKPLKAMYDSRFMPAQQLTDWDEEKYPLVAAVNSFGFGGINTHVILEPYAASGKEDTVDLPVQSKAKPNDKPQNKMSMTLNFAHKTIDFSSLKETALQIRNRANVVSSTILALTEEDLKDPILREVNNNLREIAALQENMLNWHKAKTSKQAIEKEQTETIVEIQTPKADNTSTVEKNISFNLNEHPYLTDHTIVIQPKSRILEELNPVVPFAMTVETLLDQAKELSAEKKVLHLSSGRALKWIAVNEPFTSTIIANRKTDNCVSWSIPMYAEADITTGDAFPDVPEKYKTTIDLGENIFPKLPDKEEIYGLHLFHGQTYQSIAEIMQFTKKGIKALVFQAEGKGSLIDSFGQLVGLYCHLTLDKNWVSFPSGVEEIIFYQDFQDQAGVFECTMEVKKVTDYELLFDMIVKRDDKVWCVVKGWRNLRFDYDLNTMNTVRHPQYSTLAKRLNNNVFYYYKDPNMSASALQFLYARFLNLKERKHYDSLYPNQAREYLISRIALKDGVRKFLQKDEKDEMIYPIELSVEYDEKGKPFLYGHEKLKGLEVSIAHKGSEAVMMVSDKPVGIDIEKIEERDTSFLNVTFTSHELDLLKEKGNSPEWITRFWVAKEAYGKMLGVGLQGNPKQYEIELINEEELKIKDTWIKTVLHRNNFIVGWTQK